MRSGISIGYEHRVHHCHHQWDSAKRLTNVTVAADRSSINGAQSSVMPTGQVVGRTPEGVTHALDERFPSKETLEQHMQHPARLKVAEELIIPYCNGLISADFEVEVEDAIEPFFRRGDDFQQGIEHVVFIKLWESTSQAGASRMLEACNNLPDQLESSILVQLTAGANFSEHSSDYTHAIVARLPSEEALDSFSKHTAYVRVFIENVLPVSAGILSADFMVDPVTKSNPL